MAYQESELDRKNVTSFARDDTRASLKHIILSRGSIRGLSKFKLEFTYPLSAIAGRNGSGKSTILALAACAYHAPHDGWRLPNRTLPYYRFSDFFYQTHDEVPVDGVSIRYGIFYDKWKPSERLPEGRGLGFQERHKNKGGKWNDYATRAYRPVAYFGIDRVVPPSERSIKNQRRYLRAASNKSEIEEAAKISVGKVLGIPYEDFERRGYGAYKLPVVSLHGNRYSGFNMGAGEQALFGLFTAIHEAPRASLFVIDELELGLHEAAQKQLIDELKQLAFASAHQFIFTTHSPTILGAVPPEGRFFLSGKNGQVHITEGISPAFAAGRMSDKVKPELVVYVEDDRAKQLVLAAMTHPSRKRTKVLEVGSHSAVIAQMAARFVDGVASECDVLGVLDGDQRAAFQTHLKTFLGRVDQKKRDQAAEWLGERLDFLPTELAPERYVVSEVRAKYPNELAERFQLESTDEAIAALDKALVRGGHNEIYWLSEDLVFSPQQVWSDLCSILASKTPEDFSYLNQRISNLLSGC